VAQGAVMIDLGETEVLKRQVTEPFQRLIDFERASADIFQHPAKLSLIHEGKI
jgi:hypothetical protein